MTNTWDSWPRDQSWRVWSGKGRSTQPGECWDGLAWSSLGRPQTWEMWSCWIGAAHWGFKFSALRTRQWSQMHGLSLFSDLKLYCLLCSHFPPILSPPLFFSPLFFIKWGLLGQWDVLRSAPRIHMKSDTWLAFVIPALPLVGWDVEKGEAPGS